MEVKKSKQKNNLSLFLNDYFNLIILFVLILVLALSYFIFLGPKLKTTTAVMKDSIESQKKLFYEQERKLRDLQTVKRIYDEITPADLSKFNNVLPDSYVKERLFGELEEIVVRQGFLLGSITLSGGEEAAATGVPLPTMVSDSGEETLVNVGQISISLEVSAIDYAGLKQLLKVLEANSRIFDIRSLTFSYEANTAQLEMVTYYYKPLN